MSHVGRHFKYLGFAALALLATGPGQYGGPPPSAAVASRGIASDTTGIDSHFFDQGQDDARSPQDNSTGASGENFEGSPRTVRNRLGAKAGNSDSVALSTEATTSLRNTSRRVRPSGDPLPGSALRADDAADTVTSVARRSAPNARRVAMQNQTLSGQTTTRGSSASPPAVRVRTELVFEKKEVAPRTLVGAEATGPQGKTSARKTSSTGETPQVENASHPFAEKKGTPSVDGERMHGLLQGMISTTQQLTSNPTGEIPTTGMLDVLSWHARNLAAARAELPIWFPVIATIIAFSFLFWALARRSRDPSGE